MIRQKEHVEGSIAEAYCLEEVSSFVSTYFSDNVQTNASQPKSNNDEPIQMTDDRLSVFCHQGRPFSCLRERRHLTDKEWNTAHMYILSNTREVKDYLDGYHVAVAEMYPHLTSRQRDQIVRATFIDRFREHVVENELVIDPRFDTLSIGPQREIRRYKEYNANGYRFDTKRGGGARVTYNSGVWLNEATYADEEISDYYGVLEEIWELSYNGLNETVVLFKCSWFDKNRGTQIHPKNGIVQVRKDATGSLDDPFILASQAQQAVYLDYVSDDETHLEWVVATKTFARGRIDWANIVSAGDDDDGNFFQQAEQPLPVLVQPTFDLDDQNILIADEDEEETEDEDAGALVDDEDEDYS